MVTPENSRVTNSDSDSARNGGTFGAEGVTTSTTEWDTVTRRYKRGLGGPWLLALVGVPAILAAVGLGINGDDGDSDAAGGNTPATSQAGGGDASASPSDASSANASATPFSLQRVGDELTVKGVAPSEDVKAAMLDDLKGALPGVNIVDQVTISANAGAPPADAVGALADAAGAGGNFSFEFDGEALVLKGVAATESAKASAEAAAKAAFPGATIDNQLTVGAGGAATPSATPTPTASEPAAGTAGCATLSTDVAAITTQSMLVFANDGTSLAPASQPTIKAIAEKWKGCTTGTFTVVGYSSSPGSSAKNLQLSTARAAAVKAALVADGVTAANVVSSGKGEANPIASNATTAGQNANRRVEITVG